MADRPKDPDPSVDAIKEMKTYELDTAEGKVTIIAPTSSRFRDLQRVIAAHCRNDPVNESYGDC